MTTWTSDELTKIGTAEELEIASILQDGTLQNQRRSGSSACVDLYVSADVLGFEGCLKIARRQQMKTPVNARIAGTSPKTTQIA